ncbi:MAG: 2-C-methyl-D-erythritol 4-phosphate cytidylyltransferase [Candidatus Hatepunaea meridiana]|nr:2-C-methyl-D-erythritol 4-phosphate cytidylyltransferase [Candidatus Hatepunaea meridiana]
MKFGAVIVGAGKGERLGKQTPKCLVRINNIPLLLIATLPFDRTTLVESIILVVPPGSEEEVRLSVEELRLKSITTIVPDGERRQDSVLNGIKALPDDIDRVIIHDGARVLLSIKVLERFISVLEQESAVLMAVPVSDTLHRDSDGYALAGPDRTCLIGAQTPQGFDRHLLIEAFEIASERDLSFTDEVTMVRELLNVNARIVEGEASNIKITRPDDLIFHDQALRTRVKLLKGG